MHRIHFLFAISLATNLLFASSGHAADQALGKKLYSENCVKCHGAEMYTRKDRKVHSLSTLKTFVQGCATNLNLSWFEDEVEAVTAYMNKEFYKFK